jgi:ABC-type multidrug transport system fused ATPase/permease subunit
MDFSPARKLWQLLSAAEHRKAIVLLGLTIVGMALEMLGIGLVVPALALITQPDYIESVPILRRLSDRLGSPGPEALAVGAMLALTVIFLAKNVFIAFLTWYQTSFAYGVQLRLSQQLFEDYLRQPYSFHLQRNSAQLMRNVTGEVDILRGSALIPATLLLSEVTVLAGLCTLLIAVEPLGALIVIAVLGVAAWLSHRLTRSYVARWGQARQRHEGARIQHLQQGFGGVKDVKLYGREPLFLSLYRTHNEGNARAGRLQFTFLQFPRMWLELLAVTGLAILVLSMVVQGRPVALVLPTLALFAAAAFRVLPSVNRILTSIQALRYGVPAINTLHAELNLPKVDLSAATSHSFSFKGALELHDVTFTYPGASKPALQAVSLLVRRGETVGFIGASGSGKSTLVDVTLGLLTPDSGWVCVDGQDIRSDPRSWQDQIGYVPQSIYLTDDTLRRNVAFGIPDALIDESAVERALRAAQLDGFVRSLTDGLDTIVGERGVRLSGGQRQRIGIARALYHDPAVLVLDEATSSLDMETERGVIAAVIALQASKTILIVAHRLSTVAHCDRLYRMELGAVAEEGVPASILPSAKVAKPI